MTVIQTAELYKYIIIIIILKQLYKYAVITPLGPNYQKQHYSAQIFV